MAAKGRLSGSGLPTHYDGAPGNQSGSVEQTRRQLLRTSAISAAFLLLRATAIAAPDLQVRALGLVTFDDETIAPTDTLIGTGLDGRLFTDLSHLSPDRLVTPSPNFFVRTAASHLLPPPTNWKVRVEGRQTTGLSIQSIRAASRPMGTHLMECAGNVRLTRFGLISVAEWTGIGLPEVLERAGFRSTPSWIEISGFDEYDTQSSTSVPGASWIFNVNQLQRAGAFLATGMNSGPLTADHGAPVRLVVPGWYGCCCIKWVNRIRPVNEAAEATSQMREYAIRTLQRGIPQLAKDYDQATIDLAAVPVRIEKYSVSGKLKYRVVGLAWGGSEPVRQMQIRFNPNEEFVPVEAFTQRKADPWTVWTHTWVPRAPGVYTIRLATADSSIPARKLGLGLYDRSVQILEV